MDADYEHRTRRAYLADSIARAYHADYSRRGLKSLRARKVADWERRGVARLIDVIRPDRVVDIPAGTGKLAPVFVERRISVTSADISRAMLDLARREYESLNYHQVAFAVTDAESTDSIEGVPFDAVVCLRLMHRVPRVARRTILRAFSQTAPWLIVSYGVPTRVQRARRTLMRIPDSGHEFVNWAIIEDELSEHYHVRRRVPIARFASLEWLILCERRTETQAD